MIIPLLNYNSLKRLFLITITILLFSSPVLAGKIEVDYTIESLTNGQRNTITDFYYINAINQTTLVSNLEITERNLNEDVSLSLGAYHAINKDIYMFINGTISPTPLTVPANEYEFEANWAALSPWVLVGNYKLRNYATGVAINIYSPGFDYYLPIPFWLSARYFVADSSDGTTSHSSLLKLYYQPNNNFRAYIGYASGSELYRDIASSNVFGFNANTPLLGLQYKLNKHFGVKADLSIENRDTGVINNIVNIGSFFEW